MIFSKNDLPLIRLAMNQGAWMNIRVSHSDPSFGPPKTPDFPWVRFDSGAMI